MSKPFMSKIIVYIVVIVAIFFCIIVPQTLAFHAKESNEIANKTKDYLTQMDYYYFAQKVKEKEAEENDSDMIESEKAIKTLKQKNKAEEEKAKKLKEEQENEAKKNEFVDTTGFDKTYIKAGEKYGIPWQILSAIHQIESGRSSDSSISSYAGAQGPMQFLPSTFRKYGVDGNGDGKANINNADDAIHSAANYLKASGAQNSINSALYVYNHSNYYVNKVINSAKAIGYKA